MSKAKEVIDLLEKKLKLSDIPKDYEV